MINLLLILIVLGVFVWLFMAMLGSIMGPSFNRFNPFIGSASVHVPQVGPADQAFANGIPACGKCGYPARGISELKCPECGADLREVGIVKSGRAPIVGSGCLLPTVFSIVLFSLAALLAPIYENAYRNSYELYYDVMLQPHSSEFGYVDLSIEMREEIGPHSTLGHSIYHLNSDTTQGPSAMLAIKGFSNPPRLIRLKCEINSYRINRSAWKSLTLNMDPVTGAWHWDSPTGQPSKGKGPLSEQELLAILGSVGADTSDPQVSAEARSLADLLNGINNGMTNFNVPQYEVLLADMSRGYGDLSDMQRVLYPFFWLCLWIIILLVLARRSKLKRH